MKAPTLTHPLSDCSAKEPPVVVRTPKSRPEIKAFFRREHGMSKRYAEKMTYAVCSDPAVASEWLPSGWFTEVFEPEAGFIRRGATPGGLFTEAQHAEWLAHGGDRRA